ncbi:ClpX C4-type zinc finger [Leptospira weilii str. Ecochallenge]|nr:ClpX C4-type zinc finger [Leptospira weilii str. Ecochallenge]
MTVNKLN